jgi:hypothetical protein
VSHIPLPALRADNPIAFLAALGTLRILDGIRPAWTARLRWFNNGGWIPELSVTGDSSLTEISTALAAKLKNRATAIEFNWADVIAVPTELFHAKADAAREAATVYQRETVDFFAAFAADGATSNSGDMKPTALCMTSGQMKFLKELRVITAILALIPKSEDVSLVERFRAALAEPWNYADAQHSLGWDPTNEPVHALGAYDPSGQGKQTSVRSLVYLAAEAISLFPVFACSGRLRTTGFHRDEHRQSWFQWPIWEPELSVRSVRSLLQLGEIAHPTGREAELRSRGICAIYRSRRHEFGKGYGIFRPAQLVMVQAACPDQPPM